MENMRSNHSNGAVSGDSRFERMSEIGKGAYSAVYKGRDRTKEGCYVAMKEVRIRLNSEEGVPMTTVREIGLLRQLDKYSHPNVVRLFDVVSVRETHRDLRLNLIFEHVDQDLSQFLERQGPLDEECIQDLMKQILNGVDFIHTHRIVHRDLKPQNILVTADRKVKLADFGLARVYGFNMALTSVVVTLYYRSPEVLLKDQYCAAVDIWSCGCIFAELHTRKPLFPGSSEIDQLCKIFEAIGLPSEEDWESNAYIIPRSSFVKCIHKPLKELVPNLSLPAVCLINRMLEFNQNNRITAIEAQRSSYFGHEEPAVRQSDRLSSLSASSSSSSLSSSLDDFSDDLEEGVSALP